MHAILYQKDWNRYPTAIIDDKTKNTSWLEQAAKYKTMGVKHWYFHLALLQPELRNYDPFDPDLPEEIVQKMMYEVKYNPWYFFREIQKVPAKTAGGAGLLRANRGNIALFWCVFNAFITYLQQIRQTGKSLNVRSIVNYFHHVAAENSQHILFTKGDLRKQEIKEYKTMRSLLPNWLWAPHPKDADNQIEFTTRSKSNETKTYIPQGDPEAANGVGRGTTPILITVDEGPFLSYADISIPALVAATTNSFDDARKANAFHGIVYSTTAGDLSTKSGEYVYNNIKRIAMFFSEILYDCVDRNHAVQTILDNSKCDVPMIDISFSHLQLGYTDDWLREKIATAGGSVDKIRRDFLGQWTFGSARNPIDEKVLRIIRKSINEDFTKSTANGGADNYIIRYHVPEEQVVRRTSVLGLDLSNAVNRDSITGILTDVETTETLAAFSISESNTHFFGDFLADLFEKWPRMTLIPEAKNIWISILDKLLVELPKRGIDPGRRIYSTVVDKAENGENERKRYTEFTKGHPSERKYYPFRSQFGFPTNGPLREALYIDTFRAATNQSARGVRDPLLIDELSTLVEKNGRIDHSASGHDDHIISWLMTHWFLRYSRNLDHYGIDPTLVMTRIRNLSDEVNPSVERKVIKQERLRWDIKVVEDKIRECTSLIEQRYLESKLRSLQSELKEEYDPVAEASLDKISAKARNERVEKSKNYGNRPLFGNGIRLLRR